MTNANENFKHNQLEVAHSGDVIPDRIPTDTVKKAVLQATMASNTIRASSIPASGQNSLLTFLHLSTNVAKTTFALADREGTMDTYQLGTGASVNDTVAVRLLGNWKQPIHAVKGTFNVYNAGAGSYSAGSFGIAYELVRV